MRKALYIASSICAASLLLFAFQRCTDDPPVAPPPGTGDTLSVTVDSATTTSLTLRLHINSAGEYRLDRDGAAIWSGAISPPDTQVTDAGLLPSTKYQYSLSHIVDGNTVSVSPVTTARTMDSASHEFIWEVDTLFRPGTNFPAFFTAKAMYATSATNVYMVGYSTSHTICWHWDGTEWSSVYVRDYLAGDIADIDGIDSSFIVMAGRDYGGTRHSSMGVLNNGNLETLPIPLGDKYRTCVHVAARDEIYLGSVQGVQRYNGTEWEWLLDSTETVGNEFYPQYIHKFPDGTLEMVTQEDVPIRPTKFHLWKYSEDRFEVQDTFSVVQKDLGLIRFGPYISRGNNEEVFCTGGGTFVRKSGRWEKLFDFGGTYVTGESNNLFIVRGWDYVWHYNGSTLTNIWDDMQNRVPGLRQINSAVYIDNELFVCGEFDPIRRIVVVLRGRQVKNE